MNILVVEDSEVRTVFFKSFLSGHCVDFSSSSSSAICFLKHHIYECIFLDMDLDDGLGRGMEVAKAIVTSRSRFADIIVHSMNIAAANEVNQFLPGVLMMPFAELKQNLETHGSGLFESWIGSQEI